MSLLRRFADIPAAVTEELALRLAWGTASVYLTVAVYFGLACAAAVFLWFGKEGLVQPRAVVRLTAALFAWVLISAAGRLLAIHPYAAEALPGGLWIEPLLREFWSSGWSTALSVALGAALVAGLSHSEPASRALRRGPLLLLFLPLLWMSVSSTDVRAPEARTSPIELEAPPVIVIGIDSLRRDHVGRWGAEERLTPHLDAFLAGSYEFKDAWTVVGRTHPSYVSLLTATTPDRHGVRYNRADPFFARRLPKTLGHALIDAGYSTRYLTDDNMFSTLGLEHGFERVDQPPTMLETYAARKFMSFFFLSTLPARYTAHFLPALRHNRAVHNNYDSKDFSDAVSDAVDEELKKKRPFFLTAHLCTNHYPGSQPGPEFRAYQPSDDPAIDYFKATLKHLEDGEMHVSPERSQRLRGLYKAGVVRADAELGRILSHLKSRGLMEKAWIVVWSDHGESFTDRRGAPILPSHGLAVDEGGEDLKIVLGIRPPGGKHRVIEDKVRSIDVAPTLLEGLGLAPLPGEREGRSVKPLLSGEKMEEPLLYAESGTHWGRKLDPDAAGYDFDLVRLYRYDADSGELVTRRHFHDKLVIAKQRMVQKGSFRLVYEPLADGSKRRRFFDVEAAARPSPDVREHHPQVLEELTAALDSHLVDLEPERLKVGVKKDDLRSIWLPWLPGAFEKRNEGRAHPAD